ncbi:MAG: C1 family peptidase, partial [Xanthobacteraceae bacterium]
MPNINTAGDLRRDLVSTGQKWTVDPRFKDDVALPRFHLGGDLTKVPKVSAVPRVNIAPYLSAVSANTFLMRRRIDRGFIDAKTLAPLTRIGPADSAAASSAPPASVDWRSRFGWPWLTNIKDQGQCESCWVFSAVGVVEAMTRIEHCVWSLRSEGDVHDGLGASCGQTGGPATALNWIQSNGVADPGCWAYEESNLKYTPTADREGRTVKIDGYVTLNTIEDQKNWLDAVGPISACFEVYEDFWYGTDVSGVYSQLSDTAEGGHCIVIVGYDDSKKAWLMRNSWGTGWGNAGYCWFGYGQCGIDNNVKYGVALGATNPDPWTKRHIHNGAILESGDGAAHHNFELWTKAPRNTVRHYWRDGASLKWALAETFANDCEASPSAQATTFNRNFEMVFRTTTNRLHHWYFDQTSGKYADGGVFGPTNVAGFPAFIQGDFGAPGNFELVVQIAGGRLAHWWRPNSPIGAWEQSTVFGSN